MLSKHCITASHWPAFAIGLPMSQKVKNPHAMQQTQEMQVQPLSQEDHLEEEMAILSNILAWKIT